MNASHHNFFCQIFCGFRTCPAELMEIISNWQGMKEKTTSNENEIEKHAENVFSIND